MFEARYLFAIFLFPVFQVIFLRLQYLKNIFETFSLNPQFYFQLQLISLSQLEFLTAFFELLMKLEHIITDIMPI